MFFSGTTASDPGVPENRGPFHQSGMLITETNQNEDFAVMGIIVDEIEDIVQDFYPGMYLMDQYVDRQTNRQDHKFGFLYPYINELNDGQRVLIADFLKHLLCLSNFC